MCDLTLASGTVFNKILLWHISDGQISKRPEPDSRVKVSLTLSGHEAREKLPPEYTVEWAGGGLVIAFLAGQARV